MSIHSNRRLNWNRMAIWLTVSVALGLGIAGIAVGQARQSGAANAKALYQQALHQQDAIGDLKSAIALYFRVLEARPDRALAAQALIRVAECYQKLGDPAFNRIYGQVIRDYADQKDAVALARSRLSGNTPPSSGGITTRQAWTGPKVDFEGSISSDGRYLSFVDRDSGDLAVHDLVSGTDRRLTNNPRPYVEGFALFSVIGQDGRQVAYTWFNSDGSCELRLTGLGENGSATPRVLYKNDDVATIFPYHWSPDGKSIAVQLERKDRTTQIGLVSAANGLLRVLKSVDWRGTTKMFFSPDGRYLAYDLVSGQDSEQHDVFVLAVDGSREIPAVVHEANDVVAGWTPDGKHLLFGSDRTGALSVWALPFAGGKPAGRPKLIKSDVGGFQVLGVTQSGALYFGVGTGGKELAMATVDFNSGTILTPSVRPIERFIGANSYPDWSPDGKYLSYTSQRDPFGQRLTLVIRSLETGQNRELNAPLTYVRWPRWSPDGRSFVAQGQDFKGREGIYRIDAQSGVADMIVPGTERALPEWSADGKKIFYRSVDPAQQDHVIIEHDVASGTEREIMRGKALLALCPSPDGAYLAVVSVLNRNQPTRETVLLAVPLVGGEPRELVRVKFLITSGNGATNHNVTWTRDSRSVLFHEMPASGVKSGLWMVTLSGGQPRKIDLGLEATRGARVHPDGKRVVFIAPDNETRDVWVMENFLSNLKATP